jgi:hypothetical protein
MDKSSGAPAQHRVAAYVAPLAADPTELYDIEPGGFRRTKAAIGLARSEITRGQ